MEARRKKREKIFFETFDDNGAGFSGSPFETWTVGGVPIGAGHWERFVDTSREPNLTLGTGDYAAVRMESGEFLDTLVWMISPIIDVRQFSDLVLSADLYFRAVGEQGEEVSEILLLRAGYQPETLRVIGEDMSHQSDPINEHMTWDISSGTDFIQVAFTWRSSSGGPSHDSIQVDNIQVTGKQKLDPPKPPRIQRK
jgi:hypothetical protein